MNEEVRCMFRPKEMSRLVIIGSKQSLESTISLLHRLKVAHIVDYVPAESTGDLKLGSPTLKASWASEKLVKLRSGMKALDIDEGTQNKKNKFHESSVSKDLDRKIMALEVEINTAVGTRAKIDDELKTIDDRLVQLRPFVTLGIALENFSHYKSLTVFVGTVQNTKKLETTIRVITDEYELFTSDENDGMIALFVENKNREKILKTLQEHGYSDLKVPEGSGDVKNLIQELETRILLLKKLREVAAGDLQELRKKHAGFILASEEYLSMEVQKAEAPVRFATTTHSFVIDCWVPKKDVTSLMKIFVEKTNDELLVEEIETGYDEEPPVELDNPKPVKPFEFLINLYSTPSYKEIDPSFILCLIFPLFFGFMIGDLGYGILLIITGIFFMKKFKDNEALHSIGWFIIVAGAFAAIFGLLLYGDMFGLSFMPPPTGHSGTATYSWSSLIGFDIPIPSRIHKIESSGVTQLLVISIIAGFIHLALGLIFGIINERKYNKKHAAGKLGLLFVLTGLTFIVFAMANGTIGRWLAPIKSTFIWSDIIVPIHTGMTLSGFSLPYSSITLIVAGFVILLVSVGGFGILEVLEVASHLISYTRLAAICVAKGAMALAFNTIGLGLILSGNIAFGIIGVVVVIIMQMFVFILGSLSSGIQALRLHYVEFFMKFYKGGGIKFAPFGYIRKYTTAI